MKRSLVALLALMLVAGMVLTACGAATPAPQPTQPPQAAEPTAAPPPTQPPAPTAPPPAAVTLTLWHGWTGAEADALAEVVKAFGASNPNVKVDLLAVPFDQLRNKYTTETSTGGGPDLMIGPKDWIGELSQAGLIVALDDLAGQIGLGNLNQAAVDANKFQGKVWALPESTEAVALWYNTDKVKTPPKDTDELLAMAAEVGLGLNTGFYHSAGLLLGAGGSLFDESARCVLDQGTGVTDALAWIAKAKATPNVIADSDGGKLDAAFKDGNVAMVFNGPWATGDYAGALGADKIAVAPPITLKYGSGGTFAPFLGTKNVFLSANSKGDSRDAALKMLNFLASTEGQGILVKVGHIPSNPNVKVDDPILAGFLKQTQSASYFPNEPEMGAVWTPGADMITKVIEGKLQPAEAVAEACQLINTANKK